MAQHVQDTLWTLLFQKEGEWDDSLFFGGGSKHCRLMLPDSPYTATWGVGSGAWDLTLHPLNIVPKASGRKVVFSPMDLPSNSKESCQLCTA